ncbi:phosphoribosylglycinamide formyltransferase [Candidatus Woesearchaeota archaeon]|nr:phosphoribosylglycinamide formyltransferase [Candidatus Woesearchaeota archaeon]
MDLHLGFIASSRGSNVCAILDEIQRGWLDADAKVIISNNPLAPVLRVGRERNLPVVCASSKTSLDRDGVILEALKTYDVNLVVLAGYLKKVGPEIIENFPQRILNIHPSLLPKYSGEGMYGMHIHEAVIHSSDHESGATVHLVTEEYDCGRILAQYKVPRYERDSAETLAERVLRVEHVLYSQTLRDIQRGIIDLDNGSALSPI